MILHVSMQDVANAAGVSLSTVSRALADSPRVKLETRQRIQKLARDMGYLPNAIARSLATRRTYTLGVVVMDIVDAFIAELVRAIDKTAIDVGYSVILANCGADPQRELAAIERLRQHRVDGIIVPDPFVADSTRPLLEQIGVPIILLNTHISPYSITTDNLDAAWQATNHLLELGHTRIAYIGCTRNREENLERKTGYEQALLARSIEPDPALAAQGDDHWSRAGWHCMEQLLRLPGPPGAVFCFNDLTAIGVIGAAHAAGLRVPDDLSVVGFDDIDLAPYLAPPLTTVAQQAEEIGAAAVDTVLGLLDGRDMPRHRTFPAKLIVRGSTK